jgi:hypothetical protein
MRLIFIMARGALPLWNRMANCQVESAHLFKNQNTFGARDKPRKTRIHKESHGDP